MKGVKINYSQSELKFVELNCKLPVAELHRQFCEKFNRDDVRAVNINSLRKRNGWLTGRTGCFEKGNEPFNKGVKGWYAKGTEKTRFPKGHKPLNHRPVGSTRITADGYTEIKMAEGMHQWKLFHRVVWERLNGKIPRGLNLIFIDGNKQNLAITNLTLVTRAQNMKRNSHYENYPKEISQLIQLQGAINRQLNRRAKNEHRQS